MSWALGDGGYEDTEETGIINAVMIDLVGGEQILFQSNYYIYYGNLNMKKLVIYITI